MHAMHRVQATNHAEASENRIHSDEIARKLGFTGALVPGVAVYGYMTAAFADEAFLGSGTASVRFLKPAYHGDWLTVSQSREGNEYTCENQHGVTLATLRTGQPNSAAHDHSVFDALPVDPERHPISWDRIGLNRPFDPWTWEADADGNATYAAQVEDRRPLFEEFVHPHWILSIANTALVRQFEMPTWIHVGSEISHLAAIRVGDAITVQAAPLEKWRHDKGHEFVRLLLRYRRGDTTTTEIEHTAIFKVAGA